MKTVDILGSHLAYTEAGEGDTTVVLLHGNPTSSHIWREVIPRLSGRARVIAPDLIGMGESGKPDIAYSFAEHAAHLEAFLDAVGADRPVLVGYDWGGALALDWAARHPDRIRGAVVMETFLRKMTWAEYPAGAVEFFRTLRTPGAGEQMALEENWFIETALRATNGGIADEDLAAEAAPGLAQADPARRGRRPVRAGRGRGSLRRLRRLARDLRDAEGAAHGERVRARLARDDRLGERALAGPGGAEHRRGRRPPRPRGRAGADRRGGVRPARTALVKGQNAKDAKQALTGVYVGQGPYPSKTSLRSG
jgi:pimeloyl-ACP methyl ester carboxylesterase